MKKSDILTGIKCLTNNPEGILPLLNCSLNNSAFEDVAVKFVCSFATSLMKRPEAKSYPDLIALAYWMRKSNIKKLEASFSSDSDFKVPVGNVIHFAPSNVDTIFIYSLFLSLLVGNRNVVRVSEKSSAQKNILISTLNTEIEKPEFLDIKERLSVVTYPHNDDITSALSLVADMRVIWGGDSTVEKISSFMLKPTATELKFANKYSLALIDAKEVALLNGEDYQKLVKNFVNDTYWFGQQGCSSPRSVAWLNSSPNELIIDKFWRDVAGMAEVMFGDEILQADAMNKIVAAQLIAVDISASKYQQYGKILTRVHLVDIAEHNRVRSEHCGAGLFFETEITELNELASVVDRKTQTISYFGFDSDSLKRDFAANKVFPDRVVPIGQSLDFDILWDGHNLLNSFTRIISFK